MGKNSYANRIAELESEVERLKDYSTRAWAQPSESSQSMKTVIDMIREIGITEDEEKIFASALIKVRNSGFQEGVAVYYRQNHPDEWWSHIRSHTRPTLSEDG